MFYEFEYQMLLSVVAIARSYPFEFGYKIHFAQGQLIQI